MDGKEPTKNTHRQLGYSHQRHSQVSQIAEQSS